MSTRYFENYRANDKIISLGRKRSMETNISKNSFFHGDKRFWPTFPRIIDCGKPQETLVKGPQAILTITVELENAIF